MTTYTTQSAVRTAFWRDNPGMDRKRIKNYAGTGKMYKTDTRCAFCDFVDMLSRNGEISNELAQRAAL